MTFWPTHVTMKQRVTMNWICNLDGRDKKCIPKSGTTKQPFRRKSRREDKISDCYEGDALRGCEVNGNEDGSGGGDPRVLLPQGQPVSGYLKQSD